MEMKHLAIMTAPITFFRQIWDELKQVVWPTRKEIARLTTVVIILSILVGLYLGGVDYVLTQFVETVLR